MNKMQVPVSIKRLRFIKPKLNLDITDVQIKSFEYLIAMVHKVVNSEKHILSANLLVLNVSLEADKIKMTKAIEGISDIKVLKITSSNRKRRIKHFKGRVGMQSGFKRMHITTNATFDLGLFFGSSDEGEEK